MTIALPGHQTLWRDYLSLTKPRVVLLHLLTAAAAMFIASAGIPSISTLVFTLLAGALVAGSSNALNCYFDRDIDALMSRTGKRPLPSGRLDPALALAFGIILFCAGLYIFSRFVSGMTAVLATGAWLYYVLVYTLLLKRHTSWSAVLGSGAGAFPPLIGWVAVTGRIEAVPFLLFAIVALWSPPHFWSLAVSRRQDYHSAGLGVMPPRHTARWIMLFTVLLIAASLLIVPLAGMGLLYLGLAGSADLCFLVFSASLLHSETNSHARRLFFYSILYLVVICAGMITDSLVTW
jgi:heme o synthase